jgi:hypothetical protein
MNYDPEYLKDDWQKDRAVQELGAEQMLRPAPKHPLYFKDDTKEEFLREIEAENVKASQQ